MLEKISVGFARWRRGAASGNSPDKEHEEEFKSKV
jgi:hypothetical protein